MAFVPHPYKNDLLLWFQYGHVGTRRAARCRRCQRVILTYRGVRLLEHLTSEHAVLRTALEATASETTVNFSPINEVPVDNLAVNNQPTYQPPPLSPLLQSEPMYWQPWQALVNFQQQEQHRATIDSLTQRLQEIEHLQQQSQQQQLQHISKIVDLIKAAMDKMCSEMFPRSDISDE